MRHIQYHDYEVTVKHYHDGLSRLYTETVNATSRFEAEQIAITHLTNKLKRPYGYKVVTAKRV